MATDHGLIRVADAIDRVADALVLAVGVLSQESDEDED